MRVYGLEETLNVIKTKNAKAEEIEKIAILGSFLETGELTSKIKAVSEAHTNLITSIFKNLRSDTYFIERLQDSLPVEGFVVDLLAPISIPYETAIDISKVITSQKYNRDANTKYANLLITNTESASVISNLNSPYIEHLLQKFSSLYARIGTTDISKADLEILRSLHEI